MSSATHIETAPGDRIAIHYKLIYGLGAFVNNTLAAAIGSMIIVLNLGFGMSPALVGLLVALPRVTDAVTDPLMDYIFFPAAASAVAIRAVASYSITEEKAHEIRAKLEARRGTG